jgi:hypothetical protein
MTNFVEEHRQSHRSHRLLHRSPFPRRLKARQKLIYCADNHSRTTTVLAELPNPNPPRLLPMFTHRPRLLPPLTPIIATLTCSLPLCQGNAQRSFDFISICCSRQKEGSIVCRKLAHVPWVSWAKSGAHPPLPSSLMTLHQQCESTSMMTGARPLVTTLLGEALQVQSRPLPSIQKQPLQMSSACITLLRRPHACPGPSMLLYAQSNLCHLSACSLKVGQLRSRKQLQVRAHFHFSTITATPLTAISRFHTLRR